MTSVYAFRQVDVFTSEPLLGNPVAVVHKADGMTDEQMAAFARWTNLSETTFLLAPTTSEADYRLRIFSPNGELPFAGHPTLGSAHAWLQGGGQPRGDALVQECGVGLVSVRRDGNRLGFAAPPMRRSGPITAEERQAVTRALRVPDSAIVEATWADNGPSFIAVLLESAEAVLALQPDFERFPSPESGIAGFGVVGAYPEGSDAAVEVRVFSPGIGIKEDPATGSFNAALGVWLAGDRLPASYVASQGIALGRRARVHVETDDDGVIWVSGDTATTVLGNVFL